MRSQRIVYLAILLTVSVSACAVGLHFFSRAHPDWTYRQVTARELPLGIHAVDYNWEVNDNFFNVSHYWLLRGDGAALREFAHDAGLEQSTEDSKSALPVLSRRFALRRQPTVLVGFEGNQPRNNWLWLFDDGSTALYEFN